MVLMFDGPSLGGFVCPATIISSELWKMGQVAANDTVEFKRLTLGNASPLHFVFALLQLKMSHMLCIPNCEMGCICLACFELGRCHLLMKGRTRMQT